MASNARKMGIGIGAAGALGATGINLELNFSPQMGMILAFGLGSQYQTTKLQIKIF